MELHQWKRIQGSKSTRDPGFYRSSSQKIRYSREYEPDERMPSAFKIMLLSSPLVTKVRLKTGIYTESPIAFAEQSNTLGKEH